jgi:serine/threonine protein kinase
MADDKAEPDQPTVVGHARAASGRAPEAQPWPEGQAWEGDAGADHPELLAADPAWYELGPEIAGGGMGRVLLARDRRLGRVLAIKVMRAETPEHLARFVNEARITARLQHPAIVNVHEAGRLPSGEPFYAMKRVVGRPLSEVIVAAATLEERLALLPRLLTVAEAIAYAHAEGIVHRDLKPQNIMVGDFGETVVLDWGIAKEIGAAEPAPAAAAGPAKAGPGFTVVGTVLGTPGFMAPEQAAGEPVGLRADVFALGSLLYLLVAGEPPYRGRSGSAVIRAVQERAPAPLGERFPGVPPDLVAIVEKAMARDPAARYPSAKELADDLRRFLTGQLVAVHRYSTWQLVRRWRARHRAAVAVAAVALAALLAGGAVAVRGVLAERDRARTSRALAETERAGAEDLIDFMLRTLGERLKGVGRLDLLDGVSARVLAYYERVGAGAALTSAQQGLRASALVLLGDGERERGHDDEARREYERALRIDEARLAAAPGDLELERALSTVVGRLANIDQQQGNLEAALAGFRRDLEIAERLAALRPDNTEYQLDHAISWQTMGELEMRRRRFDDAERALRKAQAILEALVAQHPDAPAYASALAMTWQELGDNAEARDDKDGAVAAYRKGLDIMLPLLALEPTNLVWRRRLSVLWSNLGYVERERGRLDAALEAFAKDLAITQELAASDRSNQTYQRDLVVSRSNIGDVQLARGDAAAALAAYQEALASTQDRLATAPTNTLWQSDAAELHASIGAAQLALGRVAEARAALRRAVTAREALAAHDATDSQRQIDLADAWLELADASRRAGDRAAAHDAAAAALRVCEALGPTQDREVAELAARARAALAPAP